MKFLGTFRDRRQRQEETRLRGEDAGAENTQQLSLPPSIVQTLVCSHLNHGGGLQPCPMKFHPPHHSQTVLSEVRTWSHPLCSSAPLKAPRRFRTKCWLRGLHQDSLPDPGTRLSPQPHPRPHPHTQPSSPPNPAAPRSLHAEPRGMGLASQIPFSSPLFLWPTPPHTSNIISYVTTSK